VCLGDSGKVTTVVATPGQGPDRPQEVSYTDIKVIGNGSFGVVYQARLIDSQEMVAIKKVLQDKRFKVRGVRKPDCVQTNVSIIIKYPKMHQTLSNVNATSPLNREKTFHVAI